MNTSVQARYNDEFNQRDIFEWYDPENLILKNRVYLRLRPDETSRQNTSR
jgi:hypothetical protein